MSALQLLLGELAITVTDGSVWLAIGEALLFGGVCLLFGTWVARTVGLLESDAPAGETLGVGLASGLMVLAAWWAAIWSGGRSSFTPVAIAFAVAIGIRAAQRFRPRTATDFQTEISGDMFISPETSRRAGRRSTILTVLAGGLFIVGVALLYGATMAPSPRDGVQPVEFSDEAYYAVLGRDLATTGTESVISASGFDVLPDLPVQAWYHWAELWLAAAVITTLGIAPMAARYFVVLPVVLLAAAALTGTVVRRWAHTKSRGAYAFGILACLFLAPIPLISGPFFSSWAVGMIFGVTLYGLSSVAVLLLLWWLAVLGRRTVTWALALYVGSALAFILPAHIVIALLAYVGVGIICLIWIAQSIKATRRLPMVSPGWRRMLIAAGALVVATVVWGTWTGHGLGVGSGPPIVLPFNPSWRASVAITFLGAGTFLAIAFSWPLVRTRVPVLGALYIATLVVLVGGAVLWGARLGDFTMFYLFYGGIAVIATPVAAIAIWTLWDHLRATRRLTMAAGLIVLAVIQLELGAWNVTLRLQQFGPHDYQPIAVDLLDAISRLPPDAKLAYVCQPLDEVGFGVPQLVSIDGHADRRVVPMCFEAETLSSLNGASRSPDVQNLVFEWAPQQALYPTVTAKPTAAAVSAFLKDYGIDYIYADATHPNSLVTDAIPIAKSGNAEILRVP